MKIFIFESIGQVSDNWHKNGGLVIIAENIEAAKLLIKIDSSIEPTDEEWLSVENFDLIGNPEPKYWVMPDAGCC